MMGEEKTLVNVNKGQDPYSIIGNYILNHITAIEDMIAVIQINGVIIKELYMVDVDADGYFYWESDWWEGEEDVALLDFFPVSDAERNQMEWIPCSVQLPILGIRYNVTYESGEVGYADFRNKVIYGNKYIENVWGIPEYYEDDGQVVAWMPLPKPYKGE